MQKPNNTHSGEVSILYLTCIFYWQVEWWQCEKVSSLPFSGHNESLVCSFLFQLTPVQCNILILQHGYRCSIPGIFMAMLKPLSVTLRHKETEKIISKSLFFSSASNKKHMVREHSYTGPHMQSGTKTKRWDRRRKARQAIDRRTHNTFSSRCTRHEWRVRKQNRTRHETHAPPITWLQCCLCSTTQGRRSALLALLVKETKRWVPNVLSHFFFVRHDIMYAQWQVSLFFTANAWTAFLLHFHQKAVQFNQSKAKLSWEQATTNCQSSQTLDHSLN